MALDNVRILHDRSIESGATDPLLSALVDKLPAAGTSWSAADRQAWLTMASNAFDVVYGVERGAPVASPRSPAPTRQAKPKAVKGQARDQAAAGAEGRAGPGLLHRQAALRPQARRRSHHAD
jgi:hypothetical protein